MKKIRGMIHRIYDHYIVRIIQYAKNQFCLERLCYGRPVIKCFSQIKNESDIVEDWILYHGYLFGFENLYIMDDGSDDGTELILKKYESKINIIWLSSEQSGIPMKSANFDTVMKSQKDFCDFMIPLDGDEFVALPESTDRDKIINEFNRLNKACWGAFKFNNWRESITTHDHENPIIEIKTFRLSYLPYHMKKVFFRAKHYVTVGFGQHYAYVDSKYKDAYISNLCLYHYNFRGIKHIEKKTLNNAQGYDFFKSAHRGGSAYKKGYELYSQGKFDEFVQSITRRKYTIQSTIIADRISELRKSAFNG